MQNELEATAGEEVIACLLSEREQAIRASQANRARPVRPG